MLRGLFFALLARGGSARENEGMDEKPERRRFQLSLRTLFELVALLAIALAWFFAPEARGDGRYQTLTVHLQKTGREAILLVDTRTGECWKMDEFANTWRPFADPLPTR